MRTRRDPTVRTESERRVRASNAAPRSLLAIATAFALIAPPARVAGAQGGTPAPVVTRADSVTLLLDRAEQTIRTGGLNDDNMRYARRLATQAARRARAAGDLRGELRAWSVAAWSLVLYDPMDSALVFRGWQLDVARRIGDPELERDAEIALANAHDQAGHRDTAMAMLRDVAARARQRGDSTSAGLALLNLAGVEDTLAVDSALAHAGAALVLLDPVRDSVAATDASQYMGWLARHAAGVRLASGDTAGTIALLGRASDALRTMRMHWIVWDVDTALATLHLARADTAAALLRLRGVVDQARHDGHVSYLQAVLPRLIALEDGVVPADTLIRRLRLLASVTRGSADAAASYERIADEYARTARPDSAKAFLVDAAAAEIEAGSSDRLWRVYERLTVLHASTPAPSDSARMYSTMGFRAVRDVLLGLRDADTAPAVLRDCRAWGTMIANHYHVTRAFQDSAALATVVGAVEALESLPDSVRLHLGTDAVPLIAPVDLDRLRRDALLAAAGLNAPDSDYPARFALRRRERWIEPADSAVRPPEPWTDSLRRQIQCVAFDPDDPLAFSESALNSVTPADTAVVAYALVDDVLLTWLLHGFEPVRLWQRRLPAEDAAVLRSASAERARGDALLFPDSLRAAIPGDSHVVVLVVSPNMRGVAAGDRVITVVAARVHVQADPSLRAALPPP